MPLTERPTSAPRIRRALGAVILLSVLVVAGSARGGEAEQIEAFLERYETIAAEAEAGHVASAADAFRELAGDAESDGLGRDAVLAALKARMNCLDAITADVAMRDTARRILEWERGAEDVLDHAGACADLGYLEARLGNLETAMRLLEDGERVLASQAGERALRVRALIWNRLAHVAQQSGHVSRALSASRRAAEVLRGLGDRQGLSESLLLLGDLHHALGDPPHARTLYLEGLELLDGEGDGPYRADALMRLARLAWVAGRPEDAVPYFDEALALFREVSDDRAAASLLLLRGHMDCGRGVLDEAREACRSAMDLAKDDRHLMARVHLLAAALADEGLALPEQDGSVPEAARAAERHRRVALRYAEEGDDIELKARALHAIAVERIEAGDPDFAAVYERRALDALQAVGAGLAPLSDVSLRARWWGGARTVERIAFSTSSLEETYELLERSRAVALARGLSGASGKPHAGDEPAVISAARERLVESERRCRAARNERDLSLIRPARAEVTRARAEYGRAITEAQQLLSPAWTGLHPPPLASLRSGLDEGTVLVLAGVRADRTYALVVAKDGAHVADLGATRALRAAVLDLRDAIREGVDPETPLDVLRQGLLARLKLPTGTATVLLSPNGVLSQVPFTLLAPSLAFAFVPSATTYALLARQPAGQDAPVLGLGDPAYPERAFSPQAVDIARVRAGDLIRLPGTRGEVVAATGASGVRLLGEDATEERLLEALRGRGRWRSVHLACHGIVDDRHPAWSALALTPGPRHDGYLYVIEVLGLHVPADLAVLSACDSGLGRDVAGEGLLGLASAFLYAGASRVLASLWKVDDDATQAFMTRFYELWCPRDGTPPESASEALRLATWAVRTHPGHPEWRHPRYWAAWVLWGLAH